VYGLEYLLKTYAHIKYVSFEPLTERLDMDLHRLDWIIVGAQTNPYRLPRRKWVDELVEQAMLQNNPVFMKHDLQSITADPLIQAFPSVLNSQEVME
jgi:protein gp37